MEISQWDHTLHWSRIFSEVAFEFLFLFDFKMNFFLFLVKKHAKNESLCPNVIQCSLTTQCGINTKVILFLCFLFVCKIIHEFSF